MKSFKFNTNPREKMFSRLLFDIYTQIDNALNKEKPNDVSRAEIARRLGKDKAAVSRLLNTRGNMTLESWSDLAWALDHVIEVKMTPKIELEANSGSWHAISDNVIPLTSTTTASFKDKKQLGSWYQHGSETRAAL